MKRIELPVDKIIADYKQGLSSLQLATKYKTSKPIILKRLRENNIERRPLTEACRKNTLDIAFFDKIDSEEKAYWLGFLLADGNIQYCGRFDKGRMIRVALQKRDRGHLVKYFKALKSSHRLVPNHKLKSVWAKFTSIPLAHALEEKGWHEFKRKGDTRILDGVPKSLRIHLIRGLIDGDGWISKRKNRPTKTKWILGFVDLHKSVVAWVRSCLIELGVKGEVGVFQQKNNKSWRFVFSNQSVPPVLKRLYEGSSVSLDRKMKLATEAMRAIAPQK